MGKLCTASGPGIASRGQHPHRPLPWRGVTPLGGHKYLGQPDFIALVSSDAPGKPAGSNTDGPIFYRGSNSQETCSRPTARGAPWVHPEPDSEHRETLTPRLLDGSAHGRRSEQRAVGSSSPRSGGPRLEARGKRCVQGRRPRPDDLASPGSPIPPETPGLTDGTCSTGNKNTPPAKSRWRSCLRWAGI